MSVTRLDIAEALSTVDGISGSEFRPSVLTAGVAWANIASHDRAEGFFVATWNVWVVLPKDEKAASVWFDEHIEDLRAALHTVVYVERDEPALIPTDAGEIFALLITARSE